MQNSLRRVAISLGSNVGDRLKMLKSALMALCERGINVTAKSRVWETMPWGETDQRRFLNMCAVIETDVNSHELLAILKQIERELGRTPSKKWGPREIDLDIIIADGEITESEFLNVPHRHMHERAFVLVPLAEIAPDMINPVTGRSVAEMERDIPDEEMIWVIRP